MRFLNLKNWLIFSLTSQGFLFPLAQQTKEFSRAFHRQKRELSSRQQQVEGYFSFFVKSRKVYNHMKMRFLVWDFALTDIKETNGWVSARAGESGVVKTSHTAVIVVVVVLRRRGSQHLGESLIPIAQTAARMARGLNADKRPCYFLVKTGLYSFVSKKDVLVGFLWGGGDPHVLENLGVIDLKQIMEFWMYSRVDTQVWEEEQWERKKSCPETGSSHWRQNHSTSSDDPNMFQLAASLEVTFILEIPSDQPKYAFVCSGDKVENLNVFALRVSKSKIFVSASSL